jgi:ribosomal protein L29
MKYTVKQLDDMNVPQLHELLKELRGKLRQMRFLVSHGEMRQVHEIKVVKRSIARIMSTLQTKSLTEQAK